MISAVWEQPNMMSSLPLSQSMYWINNNLHKVQCRYDSISKMDTMMTIAVIRHCSQRNASLLVFTIAITNTHWTTPAGKVGICGVIHYQLHSLIMWPLASEHTLSYATSQCVGILLTFFMIQVTWPFDVWK